MDHLTGETLDISEWTYFGYYDLCQYWDKQISAEIPKIGKQLGVTHRVGRQLCYWILTDKGTVIAKNTAQHLMQGEVTTDDCERCITQFHKKLDI